MTRVIIAGGGIVGLTAGRALLRAGMEVMVAEKADAIRAAGATLGLWANAVRVFDDLDVDVRLVGREAQMYFHGTSGQLLKTPEFGEEDHRYLLAHRASLNNLLAESAGYDHIRLEAAVAGFEEDQDRVTVRFADGSTERADLLIGADGLYSKVRAQLFPGTDAQEHAGHRAWRAIVKADHIGVPDDRLIVGGRHRTRGGYVRAPDGTVFWLLSRLLYVKAPAPDREPRLAELLARIRAEASYERFSTPAELDRLVRDDLAVLLSERFIARSAASAAPSSPGSGRLPADITSLVGREQAIDEVAGLLGQPEVRLVTLTGPGGVGKTRLALAVGERLRDRFDEVVFVPLETATRPGQVLAGISRALGPDLAGTDSPLRVLVEQLVGSRWLLILDNLEQVLDAAGDLGELLARSSNAAILATSRTVLELSAEHNYPVPPLSLADDPVAPPETLLASPAVALFVDRARAVRPGFALTAGNAAAVAEICRRLEGLPLAIELAAARIRLLGPGELLRRLAMSLDALGTGAVDLPQRQHTLRDTVRWSVDLLDGDERSLLEAVAIFVDGWTVDAAAQVAGLTDDRALDLSEALVRCSLIQLDSTEAGPRLRMLNIIRGFVAEQLAARPDAAEIGRRHADYYRALAERADRPLRGLDQDHAAEGLEAEAANLAAAVDWYLAHDRAPLPHLFRVLWLFWGLRDHLGEARGWIDQLSTTDSWEPDAQAELLWTAAATAVEVVGEDQATLAAASERLESLLPRISDPYLHAVSLAVMSGIAGVLGDLDGALRTETACLEELRDQDEPYWTTVAILTVGLWEAALGRHEDALGHLREARALADRFDHAGLSAWSQVQLGILALVQGRPEEARALLDEGLELSLATHSTRNVTLCLTAFAQLAFVQGDAERAALLEGAAEGLRQRVGLRVWPLQQQGEAQAVAQIRQALGADRFDQDFAAGVRLNRQQATAAARDPRSTGTAAP